MPFRPIFCFVTRNCNLSDRNSHLTRYPFTPDFSLALLLVVFSDHFVQSDFYFKLLQFLFRSSTDERRTG